MSSKWIRTFQVKAPIFAKINFQRRGFSNGTKSTIADRQDISKILIQEHEGKWLEKLKSHGLITDVVMGWKYRESKSKQGKFETVEELEKDRQFRRGVFATKPIIPNEIIIELPKRAAISRRSVIPLPIPIVSPNMKLPWPTDDEMKLGLTPETEKKFMDGLTLYVLAQRTNALSEAAGQGRWPSIWGDWILSLPLTYVNGYTISQYPELMKELKNTNLEDHVTQLRDACVHSFEDWSGFMVRRGPFQFSWAWGTVLSRSVIQDNEMYLIPLCDMINHPDKKGGENVKIEFIDDKILTKATKEIQPGEELFFSYGNKSNAELLAYYGFTLDDHAKIKFTWPLNQPKNSLGVSKLLQSGFHAVSKRDTTMNFLSIQIEAQKTREQTMNLILPFFRYTVFPDSVYEKIFRENPNIDITKPLDSTLEFQATVIAMTTLSRHLSSYPSTIEADEKYLKNLKEDEAFFQRRKVWPGLSVEEVKRDIVRCRLGEMKIIQEAVSILSEYNSR